MRITPSVSPGTGGGSAAPIVNIHEDKPGWIGSAVVGILAIQFCMLLFGFFLMAGGGFGGGGNTRLADIEKKVKELETRDAVVTAKAKAIDELLGGLKDGPKDATERVTKAEEKAARLEATIEGVREITEARDKFKGELDVKKEELKTANADAKTKKTNADRVASDLKAATEELDKLKSGATSDVASLIQNPYVVAGIAAGGILIAGIAMAFLSYRPNGIERPTNSSTNSPTKDSPRDKDRETPTVIDDPTEIDPSKIM